MFLSLEFVRERRLVYRVLFFLGFISSFIDGVGIWVYIEKKWGFFVGIVVRVN